MWPLGLRGKPLVAMPADLGFMNDPPIRNPVLTPMPPMPGLTAGLAARRRFGLSKTSIRPIGRRRRRGIGGIGIDPGLKLAIAGFEDAIAFFEPLIAFFELLIAFFELLIAFEKLLIAGFEFKVFGLKLADANFKLPQAIQEPGHPPVSRR